MNYYLFIDDYRNLNDVIPLTGHTWAVARSVEDVLEIVSQHGKPVFVSYDHDMTEPHYGGDYSDNKTGADIAYMLTKRFGFIEYQVHSKNPDAPERIKNSVVKALKEIKHV